MLLPTEHPQIRVDDDGREVTATFADRRWVFPSGDCRLLPVPNTTSELVAAYIGKRLYEALGGAAANFKRLRIEVDECDGQIGIWKWKADAE
jgi:6-pyruvoyltetrahydropterin/6-carboxytetrahydropterin synthase